ncbi:hypothetical protein OEA41_009874 [Lepraria neglecta]|uniref:Uncharacterized protein n=1 Tax=Lepraria neglecta TaxID=209136 RepID=A0AAE0DES7_9LECA|nr:hypothetical protein OEA41_009874 [Lepraria neglecta]
MGFPSTTLNNVDIREVDYSGTTTTAERLMRAIEQDGLPQDLLTREHFGLSKVDKLDDELKLMGLYKGLLVLLDNPPSTKTLHGWQQSNKLAEGILKAYS